ncbi:DEAD/DEAH box helicase family protein [Gilvimarinus agarilyticus]|uniref:DEAD/DEAH box helicase n=1 Tax=Gilvimarinus sp. 2_MG-2023 TaxID=3062666 RepID=UPI001C0A0496|nr:helicase-related protein [Gilvimarinus sp. 2_MG-2023]MBU2886742.1 DEAD/DEAH box helicase family protein [Gilvimarinus agarilyticus]MDO6571407.1 helicase-related protein [Gilvimarinus sp. 2_MG-2023]
MNQDVMDNNFQVGDWVWLEQYRQTGKIVDAHCLWGIANYRVWLSQDNSVIKVGPEQVSPLVAAQSMCAASIAYLATAARVAASQQEEALLAPMGSNVIPLPHQLKALNKAVSQSQVRYLLADEVGLGKTIEAGLIMRELKLRGLVRRILVVAPKGLATQWVSEMQVHFNESFDLMIPGEAIGTADPEENIWQRHDQVICPMDSIKPIEKRRGWNLDKINQYNKQRFDDLISAGWDLIVVDESHRLQGSTDTVARFKLGQGLADSAPYFLLLSATPHQGKSDGFHRLMTLLDREHFPDETSVTQERVKPYVIRTEKRHAIDAEGKALFRPRKTQLVTVAWQANHSVQRELYDAVTDYVREGYNKALAAKQNAIGFLMILMQRLVVSSPAAIRATLQRRLDVLNKPSLAEQASLLAPDEWEDLDGEQQTDELLNAKIKALKDEKQEVQWLLGLADKCMQQSIDAKADALLEWVTQLQREEDDPNLKVLIFTEFVPTQMMLAEFLKSRGMSVVTLNGSLSMEERKHVQKSFADESRVLISTDAGGEGLNLQFCHVIINYDIPWSPMRLEQRIGRVDRIGQKKVVRALNLVFEDTVEHRVREVLEEKLNTILEEFGVDKTSDVLDSAQAGQLFDELYTGAINNPDAIDIEIEKALEQLRSQAATSQSSKELFVDDTPVDVSEAERISLHPLPYWIERMTLSYLKSHGGVVDQNTDNSWQLTWPDGEQWDSCLFDNKLAEANQTAEHVTLDRPKIGSLLQTLPAWIPEQKIPVVSIPTIPDSVDGIWSLWQIVLDTSSLSQSKSVKETAYFPVYQTMEGKSFPATAKRVWEALLSNDPVLTQEEFLQPNQASVFSFVREQAEELGQSTYEQLKARYLDSLELEKDKVLYGFKAREKAIERIGLLEVKDYRLNKLKQERQQWELNYQERQKLKPELNAVLLLRVKPGA